jgi:hypothetical protein
MQLEAVAQDTVVLQLATHRPVFCDVKMAHSHLAVNVVERQSNQQKLSQLIGPLHPYHHRYLKHQQPKRKNQRQEAVAKDMAV